MLEAGLRLTPTLRLGAFVSAKDFLGPSTGKAATGVPQAMASSITRPKVSDRLGKTEDRRSRTPQPALSDQNSQPPHVGVTGTQPCFEVAPPHTTFVPASPFAKGFNVLFVRNPPNIQTDWMCERTGQRRHLSGWLKGNNWVSTHASMNASGENRAAPACSVPRVGTITPADGR